MPVICPGLVKAWKLCHGALQNTYCIRPFYQAWEKWQPYLMHRHKHRRLLKGGEK